LLKIRLNILRTGTRYRYRCTVYRYTSGMASLDMSLFRLEQLIIQKQLDLSVVLKMEKGMTVIKLNYKIFLLKSRN
jgi:hypothetical protein